MIPIASLSVSTYARRKSPASDATENKGLVGLGRRACELLLTPYMKQAREFNFLAIPPVQDE